MYKPVTAHPNNGSITIHPVFREREFVPDSQLVFILMPFGEAWSDRIWEAIQRIIVGHGMRPERADNRHGPVVTEDIWRGIIEARVILADVTGWNPNVFYELGISHTVGKDAILITQPSARLPFDTQGYRHIIYSDNPSGIQLLEREIPQKLDYYIKSASSPPPINKRSAKDQIRNETELAWIAITKGWNPPLPSIKLKDERSQAGAFKKRMKQYVYFLSESEAKEFVAEIKKHWPDDFESREELSEVQGIIVELASVLNRWRGKYAARAFR